MPEPTNKPTTSRATRTNKRNRKKAASSLRSLLLLLICVLVAGIAGWKIVTNFDLVPELSQPKVKVIALHPEVQSKMNTLIRQAKDRGIDVVITSDFRSSAEQDRLYRQGREDPGNIVTNARGGQSYHNYGLAIDFALLDKSGKIVWDMEQDLNDNGRSDWLEVVDLAKTLGFEWGGDWENFRDYPHFQMKFGYSLRQLQQGKAPEGSITEPLEP
ncbi:M15 family metallopeptidase [Saccharibacillus sp. JS10]|uniref:M15 family metallopeptidase n=1 Tax=Saccharibacillus sp. JS10 TaxID=2950552 RepID=UPI0035200B31